MKKILIMAICVLFASVSIATAMPLSFVAKTQTPTILVQTGTFDGTIGYQAQGGGWTAVGTLTGTYEQSARGYRFDGTWTIQKQDQTLTGTMKGVFGKHILVGRITADANGKSLPIVGFIGFKEDNFGGRFMAPVGPALYFRGTYT